MTAASAPSVFISYRRQGTAMHAGRLYDATAARFGERNVFMDLEMAPGIDFVERITTAVGSCRALLVVIGPEWLGASDGGVSGAQRLADPDDFVRLEVETALRAADVTVIPVLVAGASMPEPEQLPDSLRPLARRNAIELTDLRWRYDCSRLMTALDELLGAAAAAPARVSAPAAAPTRALVPLWLEGVAIAAGAGMLARWLGDPIRAGANATDAALILTTVARRAETWAVIGAALAIWLSVRRGEQGRLLRRTAMGLLLGALAGGLGGAIFAGLVYLPDAAVSGKAVERISVAALAATGGVLGAAIGALWVPRRVAVGCVGGALGGVLVQLGTNAFGHPSDVLALGLNCFVIVGVALFAMLSLDVRAAAGARRSEPAPQAAGA
jgi:hypothetical protein